MTTDTPYFLRLYGRATASNLPFVSIQEYLLTQRLPYPGASLPRASCASTAPSYEVHPPA